MAKKFVESNGRLYEINEKGDRGALVRSTDSSKRVYLRFTNKTSRPVDAWWRDFQGTRHHYMRLGPGSHYDVNSYITHPWEFTDASTNERYVIDNQQIYRAPENIGGMMFRTNWNITVSVRSLTYAAMIVLAQRLRDPAQARYLGLPRTIANDLEALTTTLYEDPEHSSQVAYRRRIP